MLFHIDIKWSVLSQKNFLSLRMNYTRINGQGQVTAQDIKN